MALIQLAAFCAQHQNVVDSDGIRDLKHLLQKKKNLNDAKFLPSHLNNTMTLNFYGTRNITKQQD